VQIDGKSNHPGKGMMDFLIQLINEPVSFGRLIERLANVRVFGLDLETVEWWNRERERIALVQIAYRVNGEIKVAVIDALALESLAPLSAPLEDASTLKIIHNAAFDASRLKRHYGLEVSPIHDTMVAARLNREKKYSLASQAATHLNLFLDKAAQRSDWSRRPLSPQQLHYAALDAAATLRLFEHQLKRNISGSYRLRKREPEWQPGLPLAPDLLTSSHIKSQEYEEVTGVEDSARASVEENDSLPLIETTPSFEAPGPHLALLGIITELPNRYGPEQLAVSIGVELRVGLAGWIVDRTLGKEAEFDEETAKLVIGEMCEQKLVRLTLTGRLEATTEGANLWQRLKTI
jgi:hypothetical protein